MNPTCWTPFWEPRQGKGLFSPKEAVPPVVAAEPELSLELGRYRLRFEALQKAFLPPMAGFQWRQGLERELRRLFCTQSQQADCRGCPRLRSCPFGVVCSRTLPEEMLAVNHRVIMPRPFILRSKATALGQALAVGDPFELELDLIEGGNRHLLPILAALESLARAGLGPEAVRLRLQAVEQAQGPKLDQWQSIYADGSLITPSQSLKVCAPKTAPASLELQLRTPTCLKQQQRVMGVDGFNFAAVCDSLVRRISQLSRFYGAGVGSTNHRELAAIARSISPGNVQLSEVVLPNFQGHAGQQTMQKGLVGRITIDGKRLGPLWPYLYLSQWVGCGEWTSIGLGECALA